MTEDKNQIIKEPYNPLDPKVVLDPKFFKPYIVKQFEDTTGHNIREEEQPNTLKDDAINIPVIKLNNIILKDNNIDYVQINYNGFVPTIHLSVKDSQDFIKICDTPGLDNYINVAITSEVNGYYKKIFLSFYIIDYKVYDDGYIGYDGIYKYQALNTAMFKQIGDKKLSTYEMLETIAKETELGFAAMKDCKDIKDESYRIIRSQNYIDYIQEQIKQSGTDENSIFDCWVDLFGFIVLVNVHTAMYEEIEPGQLTIYSMVGNNSIANKTSQVTPILLQRTLTNNLVNPTEYNLLFKKYENIVNNQKIYSDGALNQNYYMTSPGKDNLISVEELQVIENSLDGAKNSQGYEFKKTNFLGIEFEDSSVLFKKSLNKKFFDKLRSRRLKIELDKYNIGLERGTLVNVLFKEYDNAVIKTITPNNELEENAEGVVNPFSSGMYYIDGMEFIYKTEDRKITQYLYLIKRGSLTNPINTSIGPVSLTNE